MPEHEIVSTKYTNAAVRVNVERSIQNESGDENRPSGRTADRISKSFPEKQTELPVEQLSISDRSGPMIAQSQERFTANSPTALSHETALPLARDKAIKEIDTKGVSPLKTPLEESQSPQSTPEGGETVKNPPDAQQGVVSGASFEKDSLDGGSLMQAPGDLSVPEEDHTTLQSGEMVVSSGLPQTSSTNQPMLHIHTPPTVQPVSQSVASVGLGEGFNLSPQMSSDDSSQQRPDLQGFDSAIKVKISAQESQTQNASSTDTVDKSQLDSSLSTSSGTSEDRTQREHFRNKEAAVTALGGISSQNAFSPAITQVEQSQPASPPDPLPLPSAKSLVDSMLNTAQVDISTSNNTLGAATVEIQHPQLGQVFVKINLENGQLLLNFLMHNNASAAILRASESVLRRCIAKYGVQLRAMRVQVRGKSNSRSSQQGPKKHRVIDTEA